MKIREFNLNDNTVEGREIECRVEMGDFVDNMQEYWFICEKGIALLKYFYDNKEECFEWCMEEWFCEEVEDFIGENELALQEVCKSIAREVMYEKKHEGIDEYEDLFYNVDIGYNSLIYDYMQNFDFEGNLFFPRIRVKNYETGKDEFFDLVFDMLNYEVVAFLTKDEEDTKAVFLDSFCEKYYVNERELLKKCIDLLCRVLY